MSRFALFLTLFAFCLRLGTVVLLRDLNVGPTTTLGNDDADYEWYAWQMAQGNGYVNHHGQPTSFRAPGLPFFLAALYVPFGHSYPAAYLGFCALGALTCLCTFAIARELLDERRARLAGVLAAVYPANVHLAGCFLSENLFLPLFAFGLWLMIRSLKQPSLLRLSGAGLALGAATLTRPFALLLLPLFAAILAWRQLGQRRFQILPHLVWGMAFLLPIVPWTLRNYHVHGKPVLIATNGGSTFYGSNNDRVVTEWRQFGHWISTTELPHRDLIDAQPDEVSHDQMEWKLGWQWVREHPAAWPRLLLFKTGRLCFWLPDLDDAGKEVRAVAYLPFLLVLIPGLWACRRREYWSISWLPLHAAMLATLVTAWIFWGSPRFRDAALPALMVYAAVGCGVLLSSKLRQPAVQRTGEERTVLPEVTRSRSADSGSVPAGTRGTSQ
jgi:4-amino-4-deoxy-L-arabinose transferase-like glycosyltransferase